MNSVFKVRGQLWGGGGGKVSGGAKYSSSCDDINEDRRGLKVSEETPAKAPHQPETQRNTDEQPES